jgi:hypothetical protein
MRPEAEASGYPIVRWQKQKQKQKQEQEQEQDQEQEQEQRQTQIPFGDDKRMGDWMTNKWATNGH